MAELTFLGFAERVLEEQKRPLSPSEIWKIGVSKGYGADLKSKKGKTPSATLYSAIFTDSQAEESLFKKIGERPARYFLKRLAGSSSAELEEAATGNIIAEPPIPEPSYKEKHLHPFLAYFVKKRFQAHPKTINHATSSKKEFGEWVHPDMIGVFYPEWRDDVLNLCTSIGESVVRIYSFEIKLKLSFGNLRESFFQAVSNSSFAHQGYLVAADISTDDDFRSELRRLSTSFGIGIIELDIDDPDSSQILVPSRERDVIDWDALNKVAMNSDVQALLKRISNDWKTKEPHVQAYDKIMSLDELAQSLRSE